MTHQILNKTQAPLSLALKAHYHLTLVYYLLFIPSQIGNGDIME